MRHLQNKEWYRVSLGENHVVKNNVKFSSLGEAHDYAKLLNESLGNIYGKYDIDIMIPPRQWFVNNSYSITKTFLEDLNESVAVEMDTDIDLFQFNKKDVENLKTELLKFFDVDRYNHVGLGVVRETFNFNESEEVK